MSIQAVQEHANVHAAVSRAYQLMRDKAFGDVVAPNVGLHVERALRTARAADARRKCVCAVGKQPDPRFPRIRAHRGRHCGGECRRCDGLLGRNAHRARRAAPGDTPMQRLNARLNAASDS